MKRLLGWLVVVVVGAAAGLVGAGAPACACSCPLLTEAEAYDGADVVFAATLVKRDEPPGPSSASDDPAQLLFMADAVYKGDVTPAQHVVTAASGASCGLEVEVGERYLVHADRTGGVLEASLCGGTRPLSGTPAVAGNAARPVAAAEAAGGEEVGVEPRPHGWISQFGAGVLALLLAGGGTLSVIRHGLRGEDGTTDGGAV